MANSKNISEMKEFEIEKMVREMRKYTFDQSFNMVDYDFNDRRVYDTEYNGYKYHKKGNMVIDFSNDESLLDLRARVVEKFEKMDK